MTMELHSIDVIDEEWKQLHEWANQCCLNTELTIRDFLENVCNATFSSCMYCILRNPPIQQISTKPGSFGLKFRTILKTAKEFYNNRTSLRGELSQKGILIEESKIETPEESYELSRKRIPGMFAIFFDNDTNSIEIVMHDRFPHPTREEILEIFKKYPRINDVTIRFDTVIST